MNYINGLILGEYDVGVAAQSNLPRQFHSSLSKTPLSGSQPTSPPLHRPISNSALYENVTSIDAAADKHQHVGDIIYPLFCLPVYEHAWMSAGFGVWGKEDWLKEFWTVLDWSKVSKAFDYALQKHVRLS